MTELPVEGVFRWFSIRVGKVRTDKGESGSRAFDGRPSCCPVKLEEGTGIIPAVGVLDGGVSFVDNYGVHHPTVT